jgi:hydroxymethylglutaryl-CoA lyase
LTPRQLAEQWTADMTDSSSTSRSPAKDLFAQTADRVSIYEVSPRDGLQNEPNIVPLEAKKQLIRALTEAGLRRIEITSFVSPKWVPQLADAEELASTMTAPEGVSFSALCPNSKGLERALATGLPEIAVFMSASETHNMKNINKTIDRTIGVFSEIIPPALEAGVRVRGYLSTMWGCPYEGPVSAEASVKIARRLLDLGCYQVALSDTIGTGTPRQTHELLSRALDVMEIDQISMHMHDTRGTALANILVGLEMGIRHFDASVGGLGGCPYAPGAAGNVATEDLVFLLQGMGIETGVDLDKLIEAGNVAERVLGRALPGKVHKAGPFRLRKV